MPLRDLIKNEIKKAVRETDFDVFKSEKFGDYSTNAAMILAKELKKNPMEVANELKEHLLKSKNNLFEKIEVAGPGFINFWLSERALKIGLKNALSPFKKKKEKIQLEFISANPLGPLHIGHGRNAFYGNALANVLKTFGYNVYREFFINDSKESNQIRELGKTALGKGTSYLTDDLKLKIKKFSKNIKDLSEPEAGYFLALEIQKENEKFITETLGIKFDRWFSEERDLRAKNEFLKTLNLLKRKNLVYEKDGALWLKTTQYGDDEDRVLIRSSKDITYFLSDIAYHINKFKRGFNKVINIWGADHQGHVKRMMAVKKMFSWKGDLDILICQLVTLKEGDEIKKMSKRAGTIVWLKDLIEEVGLDVAKWFCLEKSISTHMEFDMQLAKERSEKNPVFYVQYANARMNGIISKSKFSTFNFRPKYNLQNPDIQERNLVLRLVQFPEVIGDTARDYQVHRLTNYAYELAYAFSLFYRDVRIIGSQREKELLSLVAITQKILQNTLNILGISTPQKM